MSIQLHAIPLCRHTKTDGLACKAPAMRSSAFCYHHRKLRRIRPASGRPRPTLTTRSLPPLDDFPSIQHALSLVLNGLANGRVDNRTAGQMLQIIRMASAALRKPECFQ